MNLYLTRKREYLESGYAVYSELMLGADGEVAFPAMSAVEGTALIDDRAKVEIEATAIVPD